MVDIIPPKIGNFYEKWNIQGLALVSLLLQTILILFAPLRKRTGNWVLKLLIWLAYVGTQSIASSIIGVVSYQQYQFSNPDDHVDIFPLCASFLFLHLGGPENIIALSRQDRVIMARHLGLFASLVFANGIIIGQSLNGNKVQFSAILILVVGTIKHGERIWALFFSRLSSFVKSMFKRPNEVSEATCYKVDEELDDLAVVEHAFHFFKFFKGLITDPTFNFTVHDESRQFFRNRNSEDVFRVIAVELNLIYEVLYTKAVVSHSKFGYFTRFTSWCSVVAALIIFFSIEKCGFRKIDVGIAYTLFCGAIAFEIIALVMYVFSDWTIASIQKMPKSKTRVVDMSRCFIYPAKCILALKKTNWWTGPTRSRFEWARQILFRRWSESLQTYNLIDYCLKECPKKNHGIINFLCQTVTYVIKKVGLKDTYDKVMYVSREPIRKELWDFIFNELKTKSCSRDDPNTAMWICLARGKWVSQDDNWNNESSKLMPFVLNIDYDKSLIMWHIVTDLCYGIDRTKRDDVNHRGEVHNNDNDISEISKNLSDYMLYLLIMQPSMIYAILGVSETRFNDTCAEAKNFLSRKDPGATSQGKEHIWSICCDTYAELKNIFNSKDSKREEKEKERGWACEMFLGVNTDVQPIDLKGDRSKSVLFDACIVAQKLQNVDRQEKWKLMNEVWMKLLSYAAGRCRNDIHDANLSEGGELFSFVWLLMAHFGIGDRFHITKAMQQQN